MSACGGHISHVYELYNSYTKDIVKLLSDIITNPDTIEFTEKIDGFNLHFSWDNKNNKIILARNKSDIKNKNKDSEYYVKYYLDKGLINMANAIKYACESLTDMIIKNKISKLLSECWVNAEILTPFSNNLIDYSTNQIILHNIEFNENITLFDILKENKKYKLFTIKLPINVKFDNNEMFKNDIKNEFYDDFVNISTELLNYEKLIDYYEYKLKCVIKKLVSHKDLYTKKIIIDYITERILCVMQKKTLPNISTFKKSNNLTSEDIEQVKEICNKSYNYINIARLDLDYIVSKLGFILLKYVNNNINIDINYTDLTDELMNIYNKKLYLKEIDILLNISKTFNIILYTEGVVFKYNDTHIKITGIFGILNKIIFNYRNKIILS